MAKKNHAQIDEDFRIGSSSKKDIRNQKNKALENGGKKKQERKRSGARLGRPFKETIVDVVKDPTEGIQKSVLIYLSNIGFKHGLIFRKTERAKMNEKARINNIKPWKDDHEWDQVKQKQRIDKCEYLQSVMRSFVRSSKTVLKMQQLTQAFICIGDVTADECTMQMYKMMGAVLESYLSKESDAEFDERSTYLFLQLYYFAGKFATIQIKHWVRIIKKSTRLQFFVGLMRDLKKKLIEILLNSRELIEFLKEEKEINQAIRNQGY